MEEGWGIDRWAGGMCLQRAAAKEINGFIFHSCQISNA